MGSRRQLASGAACLESTVLGAAASADGVIDVRLVGTRAVKLLLSRAIVLARVRKAKILTVATMLHPLE